MRAEDRELTRGETGVVVRAICFGDHQYVIGFVIGAESVGREIEKINGGNEPPIRETQRDSRDQRGDDEKPAIRFHKKYPSR